VDDEDEACARSSHCPLDHLLIAIGIPKCRNRSAANESFNTDRLALLSSMNCTSGSLKSTGSHHEFRTSFCCCYRRPAAAESVRLFGKATHELDPAAGHDESFEAVARR